MGQYIQTPDHLDKAQQLIDLYSADPIPPPISFNPPEDKVMVCVVQNGPFDAAAICYDIEEFLEFTQDTSGRPVSWMLMDKSKVLELVPKVKDLL